MQARAPGGRGTTAPSLLRHTCFLSLHTFSYLSCKLKKFLNTTAGRERGEGPQASVTTSWRSSEKADRNLKISKVLSSELPELLWFIQNHSPGQSAQSLKAVVILLFPTYPFILSPASSPPKYKLMPQLPFSSANYSNHNVGCDQRKGQPG